MGILNIHTKFIGHIVDDCDDRKILYDLLVSLCGEKRFVLCYIKMGAIVNLTNYGWSKEDVDALLDYFVDGLIQLVKIDSMWVIQEGVDSTLELTNPGVWIWNKHPEIHKVVHEIALNNMDFIRVLCIDTDSFFTIIKGVVISVLNVGVALKLDGKKGVVDTDEKGGGFDYISKNLINNLAYKVSCDIIYGGTRFQYEGGLINYLNSRNCDMHNKDEIIKYYCEFLNNDPLLRNSCFSMCYSIMNEFVKKNLVKMEMGKYIIASYKDISDDILLLNKLHVPKLSRIFYNSKNTIVRKKMFKEGGIKLGGVHYDCINYLSNVKYKINIDLLNNLLYLDIGNFNRITGYSNIDPGVRSSLAKDQRLFSVKYEGFNMKQSDPMVQEAFFAEWKELKSRELEIQRIESKNISIYNSLLYAITFINTDFSYDMFFDSRGRIYYSNTSISPQSSKLGKNLISFSKGKKIECKDTFMCLGYDYYKSRKILTGGLVKILNDLDTAKYALVIDWSYDLVYDSDSPLDYLNWYLTYVKYISNPEWETSYIVKFDATCSGTQHISMLLKDIKLAESVNILNFSEYGNDFYSIFAADVNKRIANKRSGVGIAKLKLLCVSRSMVKKTVMSYAYNATLSSMSDDIISHFDFKDGKYRCPNTGVCLDKAEIRELCLIIVRAIKTFSPPLTSFLLFMGHWAQLLTYFNLKISWDLPDIYNSDGVELDQRYLKIIESKVDIINFGSRTTVTRKTTTGEVDGLKQKNTFAPNFVHSLDAYHVLLFVKRFSNNFKDNVNVSVIHDCFGVGVDKLDIVRNILYDTYIDMYKDTHIMDDLYNNFVWSLKKNDVIVEHDSNSGRDYITIDDLNKNSLKDFDKIYNKDDNRVRLFLPRLEISCEKQWARSFKKNYPYNHSFT